MTPLLISRQQPDGGDDTPGVAAAPVALAGAIIPGVARFIVVLSAHADVFGVGATVIVGSMVVLPSAVITGCIVPSAGFAGICGVESGKAAPLIGGPPGVELHTVVDGLPSGDDGDMVPVVLPTLDVGIVPNAVDDIVAVDSVVVDSIVVAVLPTIGVETGTVDGVGTGVAVMVGAGGAGIAVGCGAGTVEPGMVEMNDVAGCADSVRGGVLPIADEEEVDVIGVADTDGIVPVVPPTADMEVTGTAGVPGPICPDGVEQVTTVPGVVGLEASGSGASVVSATPDKVAAENGLGPLRGEDSIVPGVDERPMAVVPMVETCARLALQHTSRATVVNIKRRIAIAPPRRSGSRTGLTYVPI